MSDDAQIRWSAKRLLDRIEAPSRVLRFRGEPGTGAPGIDESFRDMDLRLEELNRRFEGLRGGLRLDLGRGGVEQHVIVDRDGERIEVDQKEDGKVTVKVSTKGVDGKPVEQSFEAKDMAAFEKEHPEVVKKVKGLLGIDVRAYGWPEWSRQGNELLESLGGITASKPALGVTISAVPPVLRTQLSIPEGEGVVVEEVLPDTPAARLGLRRHDVILSVNGTPVSGAPQIRSAIEAVKEGGALALRILRGGKAEEIAGTR